MFTCPKCEKTIEKIISKVCPYCLLPFFNETYTSWIGSSDQCNILLKIEGIIDFAAAVVFNPESNNTELYNLNENSNNIIVNKRNVKKKEIITISDWIKINEIILDLSHPKFIPLFMSDLKVQFQVDFSDKEEFLIGNTDDAKIRFTLSYFNENYALVTKSGGNFFCGYPHITLETHQEFRPIYINELKLEYGDIKLLDRNDAVFIENERFDLNLIPGLTDTKELNFQMDLFPLEFYFSDFAKQTITIGKSGCDIALISDKICHKHLQLKKISDGKFFVKDLDSDFGTYLGNTKINECELTYGQILIFGNFELAVEKREEQEIIRIDHIKGKIKLEAENLSRRIIEYTFPLQWESVKILNEISLSVKAGELVGIMGPSGAGKSTLLKMLSGIDKVDNKFARGKILYNEIDITQNPDYFKNLIAYLPQDDILFPDLTVYECLKYVAKLRMPHLSKENIDILIDNVLISLDMAEYNDNGTLNFPLKNKKIGGVNKPGALSGGQRKRINLAVELLSNPSILFLDEPTSGLSSTGSDKLINLLVKICNAGNTIVTSIHQPSRKIFSKFNKILILTKNGKQAYFGSVQRSVDYFQRRSKIKYETTTNPAVYIMEVLDSNTPEYWEKQYKESEAYVYYIKHKLNSAIEKKDSEEKFRTTKERVPFFSQVLTLLSRNFKLKINNTTSLLLLLLQAPIIALFVGLIFSGIIKDGSKLDKFKPEEEFFRLENYSRPITSRYLPPFNEDMKIENLSSKTIWLYSQANDVVYPDTTYYERIGPYTISKQILEQSDNMYFPVKAGNYELLISDTILNEEAIRGAMKFSPINQTNSSYYVLNDGSKTFAVNDWNSLNDLQKNILWNDKVLSERKNKVQRENEQFEKYSLFDTSGKLNFLNYPFNRNYSLNQIKKYFYTKKFNKYDWFDASFEKNILFTGSNGYKEQAEKLLYLVFIMILSFIWIGMTNSVKDVVVERQIFIREHRYNLKITNYIASKFLALFLISIVQISAFLWVLYQFIPVIPSDNFTIFLILLLTSMVAGGIGLFISSLANTIEFAIFSLPLILIPQIIFAGIFKHIGAMSDFLREISTWTISRWSLESIVNSISRVVDFESPFHHFFVPFNNIIFPCYYSTLEGNIVAQKGYFPFVLEIDLLILVLFVLITFCTSSFTLFIKTKYLKK